MTTLEKTLIATVCTEKSAPLETITCGCGCPCCTEEGVTYGRVLHTVVVVGCPGEIDGGRCEAASRLGNVLWQDRHTIARFLRAFADEMLADRTRLIAAIPAEMGKS